MTNLYLGRFKRADSNSSNVTSSPLLVLSPTSRNGKKMEDIMRDRKRHTSVALKGAIKNHLAESRHIGDQPV
jgi:hypothetical protein